MITCIHYKLHCTGVKTLVPIVQVLYYARLIILLYKQRETEKCAKKRVWDKTICMKYDLKERNEEAVSSIVFSRSRESDLVISRKPHLFCDNDTNSCDLKNLGSTHYHEKMDELIFCTNDF